MEKVKSALKLEKYFVNFRHFSSLKDISSLVAANGRVMITI